MMERAIEEITRLIIKRGVSQRNNLWEIISRLKIPVLNGFKTDLIRNNPMELLLTILIFLLISFLKLPDVSSRQIASGSNIPRKPLEIICRGLTKSLISVDWSVS